MSTHHDRQQRELMLKHKRESARRRRKGLRCAWVEYDEEAMGKALYDARLLEDERDFALIPRQLQKAIDLWGAGSSLGKTAARRVEVSTVPAMRRPRTRVTAIQNPANVRKPRP